MSTGSHRGPKAEDLARELGVKAKVVLAAAHALGIAAQNRLTRLSPADATRIRNWIVESQENGATPTDG